MTPITQPPPHALATSPSCSLLLRATAAASIMCFVAPALPQTSGTTLNAITVKGTRSIAEQNQLPNTTESITARQAEETINAINVEDTLKYMPSILVRKRYIGDTNAPMATRTTGINASARSLIYADGILLSTLVNNNNGNGSPQWFMVAPEEIDRIDVMYGPFSAMYPGNSYGAVTEITTRTPQEFEASVKVNTSMQDFSYGTSDHYPATQAGVYLGDRADKLSWSLSVNHLDSYTQPVTYLTIPQSTTPASGSTPIITGARADQNRTGDPIQVLGAGNLTHTVQDAAKIKLAYDFTPSVTAAYTLGYWQNNAKASSQSYLTTSSGSPYFGSASGTANIAGNAYNASAIGRLFSSNTVDQQHWMQSLSLKAKDQGPWTWEAVAASFNYANDVTRTSTGLYPDAQTSGAGRIADAGGTGWNTLDLKGNWHPKGSRHSVSFGTHFDQYTLVNPVYNTANWVSGGNGSLYSDSRGKTGTSALWAQDAWELSPSVVATIGARYEWWRAFDGYNLSTTAGPDGRSFGVRQPEVTQSGISPKLSVAWQANDQWSVTGSFGKALRFPTVGELYQNVQTGTTFTQADPFLSPERVLSGELAIERNTQNGKLRLSLFEEHVSNALIGQTSTLPGVALPVSFVQNIDATRQRGIELAAQQKDVLIKGLELSGSITYVDARITANGSYVPTTPGATSVGKRTPYVPMWRAAVVATYRPDDRWAFTAAGRYSSRMYATVDNTDINPATYTGFESYFVTDLRVAYKFDKHWNAAAGIDNLNNRKYFLYHPFPQRTIFAELKYNF